MHKHIYEDERFAQEHAVLACLLALSPNDDLPLQRLINLYLVMQYRFVFKTGIVVGDRELLRFTDQGGQLLSLCDPDRAQKSRILNTQLLHDGTTVRLTPAAWDGLEREDMDLCALGGHLSKALKTACEDTSAHCNSWSDAEVRDAVLDMYRVPVGTWSSWDEVIQQCDHWDQYASDLRPFLLGEGLSISRCFDQVTEEIDDREAVVQSLT